MRDLSPLPSKRGGVSGSDRLQPALDSDRRRSPNAERDYCRPEQPSHPMFFPHDSAGAGVPGGTPIFGGNDGVEAVELVDVLQAGVDELPGAGAVFGYFAVRFL